MRRINRWHVRGWRVAENGYRQSYHTYMAYDGVDVAGAKALAVKIGFVEFERDPTIEGYVWVSST